LKIDKLIDKLGKRLNLLTGNTPTSKWDDDSKVDGLLLNSNWSMINATIKEHPDDSWFVPDEQRWNAWTCLVMFTIGNIELRDFELERKFADMRYARVDEYDNKCDDAIERKDWITYEKLKQQVPAIGMFWCNWSAEELAYYEDAERFPILKDGQYKPNWRIMQGT
jgi:hypothetical protein